jgi:hypothetical protein
VDSFVSRREVRCRRESQLSANQCRRRERRSVRLETEYEAVRDHAFGTQEIAPLGTRRFRKRTLRDRPQHCRVMGKGSSHLCKEPRRQLLLAVYEMRGSLERVAGPDWPNRRTPVAVRLNLCTVFLRELATAITCSRDDSRRDSDAEHTLADAPEVVAAARLFRHNPLAIRGLMDGDPSSHHLGILRP